MGRTEIPDPQTITSEPWLEKQNLQRERNGALLRVHAVVCSDSPCHGRHCQRGDISPLTFQLTTDCRFTNVSGSLGQGYAFLGSVLRHGGANVVQARAATRFAIREVTAACFFASSVGVVLGYSFGLCTRSF